MAVMMKFWVLFFFKEIDKRPPLRKPSMYLILKPSTIRNLANIHCIMKAI